MNLATSKSSKGRKKSIKRYTILHITDSYRDKIEVLSQKEAALGTQLGFEPTEEEIKEVDKLYSKYRGDWKIRKKICEELIAVLKDSVPNYSNTMEEIGLDLIDETPFKQNPLSL